MKETLKKKTLVKKPTKQKMGKSFLLNYKYALAKYRICKYCAMALNISVLAYFIYFHLQKLPLTTE